MSMKSGAAGSLRGVVVLALVGLAGCGTPTETAGGGSHASSPESGSATLSAGSGAPSSIRSTSSTSSTMSVSERDNGRVLRLARGGEIVLTLASTYWHIDAVHPSTVLRADLPTTHPRSAPGHCMPGQGCGVVTAHFHAVAAGTATITASRSSCGEALRCTPAQSSYRLTITVY